MIITEMSSTGRSLGFTGQGILSVKTHPSEAEPCKNPNSLSGRKPKLQGFPAPPKQLIREVFPQGHQNFTVCGTGFYKHERCKIERVMKSCPVVPGSG